MGQIKQANDLLTPDHKSNLPFWGCSSSNWIEVLVLNWYVIEIFVSLIQFMQQAIDLKLEQKGHQGISFI